MRGLYGCNPTYFYPFLSCLRLAVRDCLHDIARFWKVRHEQLSVTISQSSPTRRVAVSKADVDRIANEWLPYRQALNDAVLSINQARHAIMIRAVGAPVLKKVSRRQWMTWRCGVGIVVVLVICSGLAIRITRASLADSVP